MVNRAGLSERAGVAARPGMVTVFDRLAPDDAGDGGGALYVAPPPGNTVCPSVRRVDDAAVVDWESGHPVLAGLDGLDAVEAIRAVQLQVPSWGATVLTAASRHAAYPFLVAGESADGAAHVWRRAAAAARVLGHDAARAAHARDAALARRAVRRRADHARAPASRCVPAGRPFASATGVRAVGDPPVVLAERAGVHRARVPDGPTGWCSPA